MSRGGLSLAEAALVLAVLAIALRAVIAFLRKR